MNTLIKNIEKRKELAQVVYEGYGGVEQDERKEYENEVYAAYKGYTLALMDIAQIIVDANGNDAEALAAIKGHILDKINGKAKTNLFAIEKMCTTDMKDYIRTTVKEELIRKGCEKEDADVFAESFINFPEVRQKMIEEHDLDSIRICDHCGRPMYEGYMKDDFNTYCSEECVKAATGWSDETFNEHIANAESEDADIYWTMWEG